MSVRPPQQRSFEELGTPLVDVTFCVIDLETTGGDRGNDFITEVGAVKVRGGEHLGTFQTLVNPGKAIPPMISVLTGLTDVLVAQAPRIETVLPSLLEFIGPQSVIVGHNVRFDLGFLNAALLRSDRPTLANTSVDTVALARRLVRDEVRNCALGTLARQFRLPHQPTHRALDDALATVDLLHLLIERAAGWGVKGLDDLTSVARLGGHPQAAKLKLTTELPRTPGVYWFCGPRGDVLYVGKATNLRQRVRSYFGAEDRRRMGAMLRESASIHHAALPDALTAEVVETRMISALAPRYNRRGTGVDRYCYVRLDTDSAWPRLSIVRDPGRVGVHLGPLPSRSMASLVVEAIESVVSVRRCSKRLGKHHQPTLDAAPCVAAQLGVTVCPCAGQADPAEYARAVDLAAVTMRGDVAAVLAALHTRMLRLASGQRYEEAAAVRDRARALTTAVRRQALTDALRAAGTVTVTDGTTSWQLDGPRLRAPAQAPPVAAPPESCDEHDPLPRGLVDEALCLAGYFDRHADRLVATSSGPWAFPVPVAPTLDTIAASAADVLLTPTYVVMPGSAASTACAASEANAWERSQNRSSSAPARPSSSAAEAAVMPSSRDST